MSTDGGTDERTRLLYYARTQSYENQVAPRVGRINTALSYITTGWRHLTIVISNGFCPDIVCFMVRIKLSWAPLEGQNGV